MRTLIASIFVAALAAPAAAQEGTEWLAIVPKDLAAAAETLAAHRRERGLSAAVKIAEELASPDGAVEPRSVKEFVRRAYSESGGRLAYLLIVGDAPSPRDPGGIVRIPPQILAPRYTEKRWPSAKELASDAWYGMLDDDALLDVSVGRLPADTPSEAAQMARSIMHYELRSEFGAWRRRLDVVAGPGGFGPLADMFLESTFRKYVVELVPQSFDVRVTYANPVSPYCYPTASFPEKTLELFNEGSLVWAYVGHGAPTAFDSVKGPEGERPIFDLRSAARVEVRNGAPIVAVIACSTGHFDLAESDCVAEAMMKAEKGPVAVIASTRISQPYANGVLARELIVRLLDRAEPTLGKALLGAKHSLVDPKGEDQKVMDRMAGLAMGPDKLRPCREDHVHLYELFGDPATAVARAPGSAKVSAKGRPQPGGKLVVDCALDRAYKGSAVVTLEARRGAFLRPFERVNGLDGEKLDAAMERNWKIANELVVVRVELEVDGDSFRLELEVPAAGLPGGAGVIKVFASDRAGCAAGAAQVRAAQSPGEDEGEEGY